jgi:D-inositol-3-phosphate glycosyltransferase
MNQRKARNRLGFDCDEVFFLYVGRFDKLKGLDRLLEAVSMVSHPQTFRLIVVGGDGNDEPETQRLRHKCTALTIKDQVKFCGSVDHHDLPSYYNAADGLVIPSLYESFSLVALEALACGTPVLATKVGALERVIRNGKNGLVVNDAESTSLASGITEFLAWRSRRRPASSTVRESVKQYSWSNAASALMKEYLKNL